MCASPRAQAGDSILLTQAQIVALEKAKSDKAAHGEFESECPGYRGAQDTFYVGTLKGVGRIYQQTFIDTCAKVAFAKLENSVEAGFIRIFGAGWAPSELVRVRGSVITPREERGCEEDRIWHARTSAVSASSAG